MMPEMSIDACITWHRIRLEFDLEEVERAAIAGTVSYLERLKRLEEDLFSREHSQQWLSPSDCWRRANYLETGEDW